MEQPDACDDCVVGIYRLSAEKRKVPLRFSGHSPSRDVHDGGEPDLYPYGRRRLPAGADCVLSLRRDSCGHSAWDLSIRACPAKSKSLIAKTPHDCILVYYSFDAQVEYYTRYIGENPNGLSPIFTLIKESLAQAWQREMNSTE